MILNKNELKERQKICEGIEQDLFDTIYAKDNQIQDLKNELSQWSFLGDSAATDLVHDRLHVIPELRKEISAKDKHVQDMQERLDKCKEALEVVLKVLNSAKSYEFYLCKEALEAIERGDK